MAQQSLKRELQPRHIRLMAIGGMIGTGIFKGSADTISAAGPGIVFSYLFAGFLLLIVMSAIAEMAIAYPGLNIQGMIQKAFGSRFAFVVGWLYWIDWILVIIVEVLAGGSFLQYWIPSAPLWLLSLACTVLLLFINLISVKLYGEIEFWLASVKIITLVLFILLGFALLFGFIPNHEAAYFTNYTSHGGFFPKGWGSIFTALLIVVFSFGGSELIGLTVTETKNVEQTLPKVVKGVMFRVVLFYTLPILIITGLIPWDEVGKQGSPFVQVFSATGLQGVAHIMNFILLTAVLSAANSGMYATSRILYSLAQNNEAPALFSRLTKRGVPVWGVLVSCTGLLIGSFLAFLTPEHVFGYLMSIPGFTVLLIWTSICLAQFKLRKQYSKMPYFRVWLFPYSTLFAAAALAIIFIFFLFNAGNIINSIVCASILILLSVLSILFGRKESK
ncbi:MULTISPECIES: amino acid permease [Bacillus]|uniref:GABA permease (4-amino butyrate transport carrier) n=1 Tax=Bacillus cereus TaxID=1396 RepID=A0A2C1LWP6_BACCE|nr:amino acid permease [Bacillus cereus]PGU02863.1 GABA permease (4-amino butyrate transport carrier) [Bacillus cereus]